MASFDDARIAQILRGTLGFKVYDYPGHDEIKVAVRLLSDAELDDCRVQALVDLEKIAKKRRWELQLLVELDPDIYDRAVSRQIVWRSYHDADTTGTGQEPKRFFSSYEHLAGLGSVEQERLFALYLEHQRWTAPLRAGEAEEVEALVEAMGKAPSAPGLLGSFEHSTLVRLLISMARRLSTSPTSKSSST